MAVNWTPEQRNAIEARGGSLLVSAAAGSGKTAVLSQRVIALLTDPVHPVDADRLLVVTFSRAAAAEMRQRIDQKLWDLLEENPGDAALQRQQLLLEQANISTIHAFCQELVRQNFHLLGISPDFHIADDQEMKLLQSAAVEETLAAFYQEGNPDFLELVELVSGSRGDWRMEKTVLRLYGFLRSHAFYQDWMEEKLALYDPDRPAGESLWGKLLLDYARDGLGYARATARRAMELAGEEEEKTAQLYQSAFARDLEMVARLEQVLGEGDWDRFVAALRSVSFDRLPAPRGDQYRELRERMKAMRAEIKGVVEELGKKRFCALEREHREDMEALRPLVEQLFQVVCRLDQTLGAKKEDRGLVDFSDLEHLALRLLWEKGEDGVYRATPAAAAASQRFQEVLVDEFQDTNDAQETIFRAISRKGENLFMVGDVKQSIYRFRQAMPEIFIRKLEESSPYDGEHFPARIILGRNFRSRREITAFINQLFEMVMSRSVGEIDYGGEERLEAGAAYPPADPADPPVQLHLVEAPMEESRYIASLVDGLLKSGRMVGGEGERRPLKPGDICVLMRSFRQRAESLLEAFREKGIPAWCSGMEEGLLTAPETAPVIAFLKVLDNPLRDLELFHLLLSPLVGFSADRIAQVRRSRKDRPLYLCLGEEAREPGGEDCARFLEMVETLRREAAVHTAREMIFRLYDATGYLPVVRAMEFGETRLANLRLLADTAASYEERGWRGVSGFVRMLTLLESQGDDLPAATMPAQDAVQLMSVHGSKGLEFPVVILADTARRFNQSDQRSNTLLHSRLGFGCMRRDREKGVQYTTLPMEAIKVAENQGSLSEEMRILYVALTRAREQLILVGRVKEGWEKSLAGRACPLDGEGRLSPWAVSRADSFLHWLLMAALHLEGGDLLREKGGVDCRLRPGQGEGFVCRLAKGEEEPREEGEKEAPAAPLPDPALVARLEERLAWRYPFQGAVALPSKLAVSQIAQGGETFAYASRPAFLQEKGLTAAEKGTILHRFMQFADYRQAARDPAGEIRRLTGLGYFTAEESAAIDRGRVERFFRSPLAKRIFAAQKVHRELRFLWEAGEEILGPYYPLPPGETTVIQGVADCVFVEADGAVVVDYKTDRGGTGSDLIARYAPQLEIYGRVLEKMLGMPVKECILYSFQTGESIRIR